MKMIKIAGGIALILSMTHVCHAVENKQPKPSVKIKLIAINDFHGQLEPPGTLRLYQFRQ